MIWIGGMIKCWVCNSFIVNGMEGIEINKWKMIAAMWAVKRLDWLCFEEQIRKLVFIVFKKWYRQVTCGFGLLSYKIKE